MLRRASLTFIFINSFFFGQSTEAGSTIEPKYMYDTWLGLTPILINGRVQIFQIYPDGPAHKAGLKIWDYLISINGHKIKSYEDFNFLVRNIEPGKLAKIKYQRKNVVEIIDIQVEQREYLTDKVGKPAIPLTLESYIDKNRYHIKFDTGKIKLLFFLSSVNSLKDNITKNLVTYLQRDQTKNLIAYGITYVSCESVRPVKENPKEHLCDEIRINQIGKYAPLNLFYDNPVEATLAYRVEQTPAIIIIDQKNIIRYADYVTEDTIENTFTVIKNLQNPNEHSK